MSYKLGLIFSTTGSYAALGQSAFAGALGAIDKVARASGIEIEPVIRDPGGDPALYAAMTSELLDAGVRNIIGAITSWSRKDMIPILERKGGLLWYPCPYEGFECNDHVVYLGAAPNHHVVPAIDWIASQRMSRAYLVGSNYVWGWETLRLARDRLQAYGIEVVGERFIALGSDQHDHVIDEITALSPDCVVNSLIGPSSVGFVRSLGARDRSRQGKAGHLISFNQTEADLDELGAHADGLLSVGSFFAEDADPALCAVARAHAPNGRVSAFLATAHAAVEIFADSVTRAGTDAPEAVFRAASMAPVSTALGAISIDPVMRHAALAPRVAIARDGRFRVIERATAPVAADPYLSRQGLPVVDRRRPVPRPQLRIVK
ncbi:transporter substrate-binding protein [Pseudoroseicyclus aestuarii]|uniref:transporter substrate-binding protein n=1 Tax=Pseudoroseicyclus aestuarii TaxID=1795041 RepID=UPI0015E8EB1C|nr:transporter substrate-binding protein [Pseudoroseicyclus aestuarii]